MGGELLATSRNEDKLEIDFLFPTPLTLFLICSYMPRDGHRKGGDSVDSVSILPVSCAALAGAGK